MSKSFAVILSGCGHRDGSEITEAVSALIALSQKGATYKIFAPNQKTPVVNHLTGNTSHEQRNALEEAGRIARGQAQALEELNAADFDGVVFPGGYGAATVLGEIPLVQKIIREFHAQGKPIAAICIAPTLVARALGERGVTVTIGDDQGTAEQIEKTGAVHEVCGVRDFISDRDNKVITTPAYMYGDATPSEVFEGISKAIHEFVEMS